MDMIQKYRYNMSYSMNMISHTKHTSPGKGLLRQHYLSRGFPVDFRDWLENPTITRVCACVCVCVCACVCVCVPCKYMFECINTL